MNTEGPCKSNHKVKVQSIIGGKQLNDASVLYQHIASQILGCKRQHNVVSSERIKITFVIVQLLREFRSYVTKKTRTKHTQPFKSSYTEPTRTSVHSFFHLFLIRTSVSSLVLMKQKFFQHRLYLVHSIISFYTEKQLQFCEFCMLMQVWMARQKSSRHFYLCYHKEAFLARYNTTACYDCFVFHQ